MCLTQSSVKVSGTSWKYNGCCNFGPQSSRVYFTIRCEDAVREEKLHISLGTRPIKLPWPYSSSVEVTTRITETPHPLQALCSCRKPSHSDTLLDMLQVFVLFDGSTLHRSAAALLGFQSPLITSIGLKTVNPFGAFIIYTRKAGCAAFPFPATNIGRRINNRATFWTLPSASVTHYETASLCHFPMRISRTY